MWHSINAVRAFCEARDWDQFHTPRELVIGIVTEASELLQEFRFQSDEQMRQALADPSRRAAIEAELADVYFFLLRFADRFDVDLDRALAAKLAENERRYPVDVCRGSNKKTR